MSPLYWLGLVVALVGAIWLIVLAFQKSVLWGLGSLFVPFVSLIFAVMNWDVAKRPFLIQVAGVVLLVIGGMMSHPTLPAMPAAG
jgi:hypothetical protein